MSRQLSWSHIVLICQMDDDLRRNFYLELARIERWSVRETRDKALIQPYSGHEIRQSLEIYSKLSLDKAQETYDENIKDFPV